MTFFAHAYIILSMIVKENLFQYNKACDTTETKRFFWNAAGEVATVLFRNESVRIEKIVSYGEGTDIYDQAENEWVSVIEGESTLMINDEVVELKKGDSCFIPAHRPHKVLKTSNPCIWLCFFFK